MEELARVNDELGVSHVGRTCYSVKTKLMGMKVHLLTRSRLLPNRQSSGWNPHYTLAWYVRGNAPSAIGRECVWLQNVKKRAYNTCCSQAVTHPGTEQARRCLTAVIRREPVPSAWYGRRHVLWSWCLSL